MNQTIAVDDLVIHTIVEHQFGFLPAQQMFPNLNSLLLEQDISSIEDNYLDQQKRVVLCFQSFVVRTPKQIALIDTGIGNDKPRAVKQWDLKQDNPFLGGLATLGLSVNDIDVVICTHLHNDHVGWNTIRVDGRWVPTFPNARYVLPAIEFNYGMALGSKRPPLFGDSVLPIIESSKGDLVQADHQIGEHIRLMPTPGHSPGHVSVILGRTGESAVITGDLIHSPIQLRYPEAYFSSDHDKELGIQTRRSFLEKFSDTRTLCCASHFAPSSVGHLKRSGSEFRFEAFNAPTSNGWDDIA